MLSGVTVLQGYLSTHALDRNNLGLNFDAFWEAVSKVGLGPKTSTTLQLVSRNATFLSNQHKNGTTTRFGEKNLVVHSSCLASVAQSNMQFANLSPWILSVWNVLLTWTCADVAG